MTVVILLFAAGIVLLASDLFLGSVALAVCGGVAMAAGAMRLYAVSGFTPALAAGGAVLLLLAATVYAEVVVLPRTRLGRGMVVESASGAPQRPPAAEAALVGRVARAVTTLAPSGYVEIDGRRYEAFCESGHVPAGSDLRVIGLDSFRVIVTSSSTQNA